MDLKEEKKLWRKGYKFVIGLDESGRGPLAGPVVASAVVITTAKIKSSASAKASADKQKSKIKNITKNLKLLEIKDSKKLTAGKREEFYKILTNHPQIEWGIGRVGPRVIDRINILEATKLAMERAISNLKSKIKNQKSKTFTRQSFAEQNLGGRAKNEKIFLVVDGNIRINTNIPQKSIIRADETVFSCIAAGIIAKVKRDAIMKREHKKYPQYGFDRHKGYPTKFHKEQLKKHGLSVIHRRTFSPCKNLLK